MKRSNIFNPKDYVKVETRLASLQPDSKGKWGKMTVEMMLEHCSIQLKIALGQISEKSFEGPFLFRTRLGIWLSLYTVPWPKGLMTPSPMNMLRNEVDPAAFEEARKNLLSLLKQVTKTEQLRPHTFFGALDRKDWGRLIWMHLDHHLRQFGE
jgi:hypothetical protein